MRFIYISTILYTLYPLFTLKSQTLLSDSVQMPAKEYAFRPQVTVNFLVIGRSSRNSRRNNDVNYNFREFSLSGYVPVYEKKLNIKGSRLTLLLAGSLSSSRTVFRFTSTQPTIRVSAGIRVLYYSGDKNIWMFNLSPFLSESDKSYKNAVPRFFSSILYTRMVNEHFSYRLGLSYTYLFNGGTLLPLIGFRVGDYQSVFFNFQLPRDISLIWTINNHWQTGIFTRLSGGIYRFNIDDSIDRFKNKKGNAVAYRTDLLTGLMVNYSPGTRIYFSINAGIAHNRNINVAFTNQFIPVSGHVVKNAAVSPAPFINLSMSIYFGRPNYNGAYNYLIEQKAVNNSFDPGDLNFGSNQVTQDMNRVGIKDINNKDLKKLNSQYLDVYDMLLEE